MHIKINPIVGIFIFIITLITSRVEAQVMGNSPYSGFGIGQIANYNTDPVFQSLGNSRTGIFDSTVVNHYNPASYTYIANGQPLFTMGLNFTLSKLSIGNNSYNATNIQYNHFILGVPFAKNFGMAFGLKPFTRTGYNYSENVLIGQDAGINTFKGSGSANDLFFGFSVNLLEFKKHKIGIGANASYVFGGNLNQRISRLANTNIGGVEEIYYDFNAFKYELGLAYTANFNRNNSFSLGATFSPKQDLNAERSEMLYWGNVENDQTLTIVSALENIKGTVTLPQTLGLGFSYSYRPIELKTKKDKSQIYEIRFVGDFRMSSWSDYNENFISHQMQNVYRNVNELTFGVQYIPHYDYNEKLNKNNFVSKIRYKAGFYNAQLPMEFMGSEMKNTSVNIGVGIPITTQRSTSSLNISVSKGTINSLDDNSSVMKEGYWNFNIGVSIAPGRQDKWFRKFKID